MKRTIKTTSTEIIPSNMSTSSTSSFCSVSRVLRSRKLLVFQNKHMSDTHVTLSFLYILISHLSAIINNPSVTLSCALSAVRDGRGVAFCETVARIPRIGVGGTRRVRAKRCLVDDGGWCVYIQILFIRVVSGVDRIF